ncbi:hypothetical protein L228DRAFT_264560 [Xylona heveae TC161]|uniref:Uncharacterized protein n=1 Tax=Xylona heveae (strain CBS 132557 / TC161) TaxID=1328760 RepID=A0A165JEI2_XYLHT|nr:hypothetical protein L228DRAFT_264560 [Xylona heveae TC161]KZF26134.1 hypothetical protein L228DRAFT_264560 [Xylona heveae TC161]
MLRRKPTAITLTSEDVAAFEDARNRENNGGRTKPKDGAIDPNDELRPLPGEKARSSRLSPSNPLKYAHFVDFVTDIVLDQTRRCNNRLGSMGSLAPSLSRSGSIGNTKGEG